MTFAQDWQQQVGRSWATSWPETDRSFAPLTAHFLERLETVPASAILDIGCGAGELALNLAAARPEARVLGVDISPDLVAAAQERARQAGSRAEFALADAGAFVPPFAPDLLVSRHGVMFFDDPAGAFAHLHAAAAPGACLAFTCFRELARNRWAAGLGEILAEHVPPAFAPPPADGPPPPGPFAFADPLRVEAILTGAGWRDPVFEPVDFTYTVGEGADPVADAMGFLARIGPAAPALRELERAARMRLVGAMVEWLERHQRGDRVGFAAAAWLVSATRD